MEWPNDSPLSLSTSRYSFIQYLLLFSVQLNYPLYPHFTLSLWVNQFKSTNIWTTSRRVHTWTLYPSMVTCCTLHAELNPTSLLLLHSCCSSKKTMQASLAQAPHLLNRHWREPRPTWTGWPWTKNRCLIGLTVKRLLQFNTLHYAVFKCRFFYFYSGSKFVIVNECDEAFFL